MKLYNRKDILNKINNIPIHKVCFNEPSSISYDSELYRSELWITNKHDQKLIFNNIEINDRENINNLNVLIFDINDLSEKNILNYYIISQYKSVIYSNGIYIKNNNKYLFGSLYTRHGNSNSKLNFYIPSETTSNESEINLGGHEYYGYLLNFNNDNEISTALTYTSSSLYDKIKVNNLLQINNNKFICLSSEKDYYYKFDNNAHTQILDDSYNQNTTTAIIKYDENYNIEWYRKYYLTKDEFQYYDISMNYNINENHLITDDLNKYLYFTLTTNETSEYLYSYDGSNSILISEFDNNTYLSLITKINSTTGEMIWSKPIYSNEKQEIIKIRYSNDNVYILLNSKNENFTIDNVEYSANPSLIKLDKNGNVIWTKKIIKKNNITISDIVTDFVIYKNNDIEYIYLTGNYKGNIYVDDFQISSSKNSSFIAKINTTDGKIINVVNKISTDELYINSIILKQDNIFINGYFKGYVYLGGNGLNNLKYSDKYEMFIEEIKNLF